MEHPARTVNARARLEQAIMRAGAIVDVLIDPAGGFLLIQCIGIEAAEELALTIDAGVQARVIRG
ncbi:hypothetical protein J3S85_13985 [Streptomyces lavenduligriseus]|uniref:hypothetical protein n=1 Tax=Streptomyces achromogenes TaxID=67255 RepID=UPI0027AB83BE|nr:hypothetical protein J3S85_13985 [Streptomyces lavenduligriseus]